MKSHSNTILPAMAFGVLMTNSFEASAEVQWAIHLGGSGEESGYDIALDDDGNLFVSGSTDSSDFEAANNTYHTGGDAFVAKIGASGVLLSTDYFGGNGTDEGRSIVLDGAGNAFVTGTTSSTDFDGGTNTNHGGSDAFIVRLDVAAVCPTGLDGDGNTGVTDMLALLAAWDTDPGGPPDFDGDGNVGVVDLLELLANWGPCS